MKKVEKKKSNPAQVDYVGFITKALIISVVSAIAIILLGLAIYALGWVEMVVFSVIAMVALCAVGVVLAMSLVIAFAATITRNASRYTKKVVAAILFAIKNILIILLVVAGVWLFFVGRKELTVGNSESMTGWLMIMYVAFVVVVAMILRAYVEKKLSKYATKEEKARQLAVAKKAAEDARKKQLEEEAKRKVIEAEAARKADSDKSNMLLVCCITIAIIAIVVLLVSFCGWFIGTFGMVAFLLLLILLFK